MVDTLRSRRYYTYFFQSFKSDVNISWQVIRSETTSPNTSLHQTLSHPNIVALHYVIPSDSANPEYHVLEFCCEGNLHSVLHARHPPTLSNRELRHVVKGIAVALIYLKDEEIIHGHLDPYSVLLGQGFQPVRPFINDICYFILNISASRKYATSSMQEYMKRTICLHHNHSSCPLILHRKEFLFCPSIIFNSSYNVKGVTRKSGSLGLLCRYVGFGVYSTCLHGRKFLSAMHLGR